MGYVSREEEKFLKKISILEKKLNKAHIKYRWDADGEYFIVYKPSLSGYSKTSFVGYFEGEYNFGELTTSTRVDPVINSILDWLKPVKATELMKRFHLSKNKFIEMFYNETLYQLYDGEIEFDL